MLIGYARVSTIDRNLALQRDALTEAGCEKIFIEQMSGAVTDRPELMAALGFMRGGDTHVVSKLDRLARSNRNRARSGEKSPQSAKKESSACPVTDCPRF